MKKIIQQIRAGLYVAAIFLGLTIPTSAVFAAPKAPALSNPLTQSVKSLSVSQVVANFVRGVLGLAGVIAVVFIILGGIKIAFAAGNDEKVAKGKKTLIFAILGLIIAFGGFMLINVILNTATTILNIP